MSNKIKLEDLWPIIDEVISSDGEFSLTPYGISMLPLLEPGKCNVILVKPNEIKKGDIVLFVRPSGQFVLHRAICVKKDYINFCGDNEKAIEFKVPKASVRAVVKDIYVNGEKVDTNSEEHQKYLKGIYRKIRRYRLPVFLSKIKHKIFK